MYNINHIRIQSVSDIITNSSSEVFLLENDWVIEEFIKKFPNLKHIVKYLGTEEDIIDYLCNDWTGDDIENISLKYGLHDIDVRELLKTGSVVKNLKGKVYMTIPDHLDDPINFLGTNATILESDYRWKIFHTGELK